MYLKIIKTYFFFFFLLLPCLYLNAQDKSAFEYLPHPFKTRFIKKTIISKPEALCETTSYAYSSELSAEEIVEFYRNLFSQEGFVEFEEPEMNPDNSKSGILMFNRGLIETITVTVGTRDFYREELDYEVDVSQERDLLATSVYNFVNPQSHNSFPVPFNAHEGVPKRKVDFTRTGGDVKGRMLYLVPGEVDEVISFYLKEMASYGWELKLNEAFEGKHNFIEAFGGKEQINKVFSEYGIDPYSIYPGIELDTKGVGLVYERKNEICYMSITRFNDSFEVLRQMRINPEPFEKYGRIYISIVFVDKQLQEKMKPEAKKLLDQWIPTFLRHYLGQ